MHGMNSLSHPRLLFPVCTLVTCFKKSTTSLLLDRGGFIGNLVFLLVAMLAAVVVESGASHLSWKVPDGGKR